MAREPVGRVRITGDPIEDSASALVLAAKMTGKPPTDEDIAVVLKHHAQSPNPANIALVRALLP